MKYTTMICLLSLAGCTAEITEEPEISGALSEINFHTATATRADAGTTGDTENLVSGAKVRIYPYLYKTGVDKPAVDPKNYTVDGTALVPVSASSTVPETSNTTEGTTSQAMILPSGTFNFYAVSTNGSEEVPEFNTTAANGVPDAGTLVNTNGITTAALVNGIDYLHATTQQKIEYGKEMDIPLTFAHKGTRVQLKIIFGKNVHAENTEAAGNFADADVYVQATDPTDSYMRLNTGTIFFDSGSETGGLPQACSLTAGKLSEDHSGMFKMDVVKEGTPSGETPATQMATCYLLPLKAVADQKIWVQVTIENIMIGDKKHTTHTYTGKLDASAGWLPGTSNEYTLTLSGSEITFGTVVVTQWTVGDSGGEVEF